MGNFMYELGRGGTGEIYKYSFTPYSLASASFVTSSDIASTSPTGLRFKPDGTKMYVCDNDSGTIYEYDLSTAGDAETRTQVGSIATLNTSCKDIFISPDGAKLYEASDGSSNVDESDLTTPWDITSRSFVQSKSIGIGTINDIHFSPDGTIMFEFGYNAGSGEVRKYTLSTAWDVSTASLAQTNGTFPSEPTGLAFNDDGTIMYQIGWDDTIYEITLSTPWDISDTSASQNDTKATQDTDSRAIAFSVPAGIKPLGPLFMQSSL